MVFNCRRKRQILRQVFSIYIVRLILCVLVNYIFTAFRVRHFKQTVAEHWLYYVRGEIP